MVSIHAPAWGATKRSLYLQLLQLFQSTLPRGERLMSHFTVLVIGEFQSTLPRGERPVVTTKKQVNLNGFNPRSRVGSDANSIVLASEYVGFNPRSRVGSDHSSKRTVLICLSFNPRSRVGSDRQLLGEIEDVFAFQSTLPRGERLHLRAKARRVILFQSTLPRGERPIQIVSKFRVSFVSIHAPAWGATSTHQ